MRIAAAMAAAANATTLRANGFIQVHRASGDASARSPGTVPRNHRSLNPDYHVDSGSRRTNYLIPGRAGGQARAATGAFALSWLTAARRENPALLLSRESRSDESAIKLPREILRRRCRRSNVEIVRRVDD